jgi:DNA-binding MarR family transcriptional regulator
MTEPKWLDQDELAAWMPLAAVLIKLPAALDAQLRRDAGISHFDYMILASLSGQPDRTLRMSELADLASGSLSRLSHAVTRLEQRGWVRRETCPGDGRATNAILTDAGWNKIVATAPGHVETVRALVIDGLTKAQVRQLREISQRVLYRVDPDHAFPGRRGAAA